MNINQRSRRRQNALDHFRAIAENIVPHLDEDDQEGFKYHVDALINDRLTTEQVDHLSNILRYAASKMV